MAETKKFLFRATYGGMNLPEKKLAIVAVDFTEAMKKAIEATTSLNTGTTGDRYDLMAIKRGELIDVE